ncbi:MAG: DNA repair protein RadC [Saprospiraceae bacterium]
MGVFTVMANGQKGSYRIADTAIRTWAEEDRPREKLILKGRQHLSDAELLAIILGSGTRSESALGLARRLLAAFDQNLLELGKKNCADLMSFHGIGEAKAVAVIAALELGRRREALPVAQIPKVTSSHDAWRALAPFLSELDHEECWMLCLNRSNHITHRIQISTGGRSGTVVDAKIIYGKALEFKASGIIIAHNHPSGNLQPSDSDKKITKSLYAAGQQLDLPLLDHLIISSKGYYSFADDRML